MHYYDPIPIPGNTEEVDVAIVDREVEEHSPGASVQPEVVFEEAQLSSRLLSGPGQVLVVASTPIFRHLTPVTALIQFPFSCIHPPDIQ